LLDGALILRLALLVDCSAINPYLWGDSPTSYFLLSIPWLCAAEHVLVALNGLLGETNPTSGVAHYSLGLIN